MISSMDNVDPDAPAQKRLRLDSITPAYNGLPPPPQPPQTQAARHPTHPTSVQASSPPQSRPYPPHSLPPPQQPYPPPPQGQAHYPGTQPPPPLPPSDIRTYSDPRTIPSPGQRTHGVPSSTVTLPARSHSQDNMSYRPPPTPQSTAPPDIQSSRSNSISVDSKFPPPGMEHGSHPGQWPMNPEHRHNGTIPNGYNPTISPPAPSEHYPPPALPPGQQYGQPYPPPGPYMTQYANQNPQVRRKQVRATQACNHCRARKQKCDEARPCQFCRENNFDCQYKDVPPPKQDRSMMQLQDSVNSISETLRTFVDGFNSWKQSVEGRLPASRGHEIAMASNHASPEQGFGVGPSNGSRMPTPIQARSQLHRVNSMKTESPIVTHSTMSPQASTPIKQESILAAPQPPATPAESVRTDRSNATGDSSKKKNGLQSDHTTPAHKLLEEWPSMAPFCSEIESLQRLRNDGHSISDYPMQLEQDRGLIRVWGVGEGQDLNDGAQGPGSPDSSNDSEAFSPAPGKEGIWGCPPIDHSSPSTVSGSTPSDESYYQGGLGRDGRPNFHSNTLWRLHESYRKNIHSLHPFLNPSKLRRMIKEFSETYSPDVKSANATSPGSSMSTQLNPGIKRKRSGNAFGEPYSPATDLSRGGIERSLRNAIVLLVLALGRVCEHKKPLPHPQSDKSPIANGSGAWGYTRESPHGNGSFSSNDDETRPRNIDILPGMAYFSYATDILGNQQGGNTVAHCQAMILAALYLGQFARVLESWSWINNACRICQVLIKADMPKLDRKNYFVGGDDHVSPKEKYRLNLVMCAYWTCLQLESDILAEMSTLPPSGLSEKQDSIAYPSGVYEKFPSEAVEYKENSEDDKTMWIYSSQIYLRVILNDAHNTLYGATGKKKPPGFDINDVNEVTRAARVHRDILETWRKLLPPKLSWQDHEPPSTDINIARLRAKYYGGLYMILRPYLHIANHDIALPPAGPQSVWPPPADSPSGDTSASATPSYPKSMHGGLVDLTPSQSEILNLAYECIESAIQSTIAFDRVGADPNSPYLPYKSTRQQRLIVTNIFGTLHAQFGNMLVLAAVFKSRLRPYLPTNCNLTRSNLIDLFQRTIEILHEVAPNSPILRMDLEILYNVRRQLCLE